MASLVSGPQFGVKYTLTAPDGSKAVFNDDTDADYVGMLSEVSGLDSADVRESGTNRVEDDGGTHGNFWLDRRPVVLTGNIIHTTSTDRNTKMTKIKRASRALRADAQLTWTPDGGVEQFITVRRQGPPRFAGGWLKSFQVPLVAADPRIYSSTLNNISVGAVAGSGGPYSFPMTFPWGYVGGAAVTYAQILAENQGDYDSPLTIRINGPCTNPVVYNATLGKSIAFAYTLADGEYLTVDTLNHTVILNAGGTATSRYSAIDFPNTNWWRLEPGVNDIRFQPYAASGAAALTVTFRHAWE